MSLSVLSRINAGAPWGQGLGGVPELSNAEIVGALSGRNERGRRLSEEAIWVAQVFYGLDSAGGTKRLIQAIALKLAKSCGEPFRRHRTLTEDPAEFLTLLAATVCAQHFGGYHCTVCYGTGLNTFSKKCMVCDGTGRGERGDAEKAADLGITKKAYQTYWKPKVQEMQGVLQSWENEAAAHVWHQLRTYDEEKNGPIDDR